MAFTGNYLCNSFKLGMPKAEFNFGVGTTDVFKIALYTNSATLDSSTDAYTTTGEVTDAGYSAGGSVLTPSVSEDQGITFIDFEDVSWSGVITARGALIYKDGGAAICVLDFGSDKKSSTSFQVQFPANTSSSALIRIP